MAKNSKPKDIDTRQVFDSMRYLYVKGMLNTEVIDIVSQYALFDQLQNFHPEDGDGQIPGTHSQYADPVMESLLLKLHPSMEEITGLTLYPTYSFYRVYKTGDILHKHVDRPACEISTTVCFNFDYKDLNDKYDWPIWMVDTPVTMSPGDGVIYRGCELTHWREQLEVPEGSWHVQAFFHYVDANGPNATSKFDSRPYIGFKDPMSSAMERVVSNKKYITFTE